MKKILLWLLMVVLVVAISGVFSLAGCKTDTAAGEETVEEAAEETTEEAVEETNETASEPITINVAAALGWVTTDGILPPIKEELAKENIIVNIVASDQNTMMNKETLAASTGTGEFDIFLAWEALMPQLKDACEPLDQYLTDAGVDPGAFKETLYPSVVDMISDDGQMWWMPIHVNAQLGYARTDLFTDEDEKAAFKAEYGYDLPQPDENGAIVFEDKEIFLDVAKFFTRPDEDFYGYAFTGQGAFFTCVFLEYMLRNNLEYFDADGHCLWGPAHPENQKKVEEIAAYWQDMVLVHKVSSPGTVGQGMTEVNEFFKEGKSAMAFSWLVDFWNDDIKPEVTANWNDTIPSTWAADFMNSDPDAKGFMSLWCFGLSKDSKNKEAAVKFLLKCADVELRKNAQAAGLTCTNGNIELTDWSVANGYSPGAYGIALKSEGPLHPITKKNWPESQAVFTVISDLSETLMTGGITAAEFTKNSGDEIEAIMKDAGYFE